MTQVFELLDSNITILSIFKFLKLLLFIIFLAHWLACLFFYFGSLTEYNVKYIFIY